MDAFDVIVIGGGIGGLNVAEKLSRSKRVLLVDERSYWGGRIYTNGRPQYEAGAARFSNKHPLLMRLIKKYNLKTFPLPKGIDYLHLGDCIEFHSDVNKKLDSYFKNLVLKSNNYSEKMLRDITLYDFMNLQNDEETSQEIVDMFGYYTEIKVMNAYDALRTFESDFVNVKYYILADGLSRLCEELVVNAASNGCVCKNNTQVADVRRQNELIEVKTNNGVFLGSKVVFAIKANQLKHFDILKSVHKHINAVHNAELLRIYAKYPIRSSGVWFNNLRRMTTNSFLRQIIPIDYAKGLIMVSYTDGIDTAAFKDKNGKLMNGEKIKIKVQNELMRLFGIRIPQPSYFKVHYWDVGAHHWKPGYDSSKISAEMLNPVESVYVCGEAFSNKQAWIEGALETSSRVSMLI